MKRLILLVALLFVVSSLPSVVHADGKGKVRKKAVPCSAMKAKARKKCEAKQAAAAAAAERRRQEAARRIELAHQAKENSLRAQSAASIAKDKTEGEDLRIRDEAIKALDGKAGTVVVMEAKTGRVVTMVNQEWAVKHGFVPCSTIKLVTGAAAVDDEVIQSDGTIKDSKSKLVLDYAIAKSDNTYFQQAGAKVGNDKFVRTAKAFGLGEKTGINLEGEISGQLPYVQKTVLQYSHGDDTKVTPLQEAVMASAIVNGGRKFKPFIQKPGQVITPQFTQINIPQEVLKQLHAGMQGATTSGTARRSGGANYGMVGKTGTCSDNISRIGLFASAGPIDNPAYAVVVIIRGRRDQTNGPLAAIIAGRLYPALFEKNTTEVAAAIGR